MNKALIVDDHPLIRSSVKILLKREQFDVVLESDNGTDAVHLAKEHEPGLIVLDLAMPKLGGLDVIKRLSTLKLPSRVLVLTSHSALFYALRCMKAGAAGFVSKSNDLDEFIKAVRAISSGYTFFPNLATNSVRRTDIDATELELIQSLSDRELAILQQLAYGFSNKEIADAMLISNKTVSTYKTRIIEKLRVTSVVYLAEFAKRNNLV